jgi:hypothetical protein
MTRTKLIVGLITSHRTHLTITKTRKGRPRPDPGCSATDECVSIIPHKKQSQSYDFPVFEENSLQARRNNTCISSRPVSPLKIVIRLSITIT